MASNLSVALFQHPFPQYLVAQELGISETRLSRIAKGRVAPTEDEKLGLARILGLDVESLFPESGAK